MNCRPGIWTNFPTRRPTSLHLRTTSRDWFLPTYDNVLCSLVFSSAPTLPRSPRPGASNPLRSKTHGRYNFTSLQLESPVTWTSSVRLFYSLKIIFVFFYNHYNIVGVKLCYFVKLQNCHGKIRYFSVSRWRQSLRFCEDVKELIDGL